MVEDLGNVGIQLSEVTGTMVEDLGNVGIQLSEVTGTNGRGFRKRDCLVGKIPTMSILIHNETSFRH